MFERLSGIPKSDITPSRILSEASSDPRDLLPFAYYTTRLLRSEQLSVHDFGLELLHRLEKTRDPEKQAFLLSTLFLVESNQTFYPGTSEYLAELKTLYGNDLKFSMPFKRFVGERFRIIHDPKSRRLYESPQEAANVLELLRVNENFFHDILEVQSYFTQTVSPTMPLSATWNPELTERFHVKNSEGIWYLYAHNLGQIYVESMERHTSSEWTGFHRFSDEPWEYIRKITNADGKLVDIGASIGISALEITEALDMHDTVVLVDLINPFRSASSLRVVDYKNPIKKFIPVEEAVRRMEQLQRDRTIVALYGVDIGEQLSLEITQHMQDAAFVHIANTLPYIPADRIYTAMNNLINLTSRRGGVLRIHNDIELPLAHPFRSVTMQKKDNCFTVYYDLLRMHSI